MLIFASAKESSMSTTPGDNRDRTYSQFFYSHVPNSLSNIIIMLIFALVREFSMLITLRDNYNSR